jgi:hypothetical protein
VCVCVCVVQQTHDDKHGTVAESHRRTWQTGAWRHRSLDAGKHARLTRSAVRRHCLGRAMVLGFADKQRIAVPRRRSSTVFDKSRQISASKRINNRKSPLPFSVDANAIVQHTYIIEKHRSNAIIIDANRVFVHCQSDNCIRFIGKRMILILIERKI